jgi:hypothetical protein
MVKFGEVVVMQGTLFILFNVASQIALLPKARNHTKQILVNNWCKLQFSVDKNEGCFLVAKVSIILQLHVHYMR